MSKILVTEDDPGVQSFLLQALRESGYHPVACADGSTAAALGPDFDLILLDLMLPGQSGLQACKQLRGQGCRVPILIITAKDKLEDKVECLDAGADDYLVKPFQLAELLARIRALLRRPHQLEMPVYQVGDLVLDPASHKVSRGERTIKLSATEYSLLESLLRHAGKVVTRSTLLEEVWDYDFQGQDNVLDVYISYLRSKIDKGEPRKLIQTVRGIGYRLEVQ